jgi:hypothetical protein
VSGQNVPAALPLGKTGGIHRMGGWVGPRLGLEILEKGGEKIGSLVKNRKSGKKRSVLNLGCLKVPRKTT